ncbi:hypothetical protein LZ30DRAFT_585948 [Colletotrichum cereale]|nr:hypothetical protein LZ30DRAFT_585948 [Colletotrichum cereale]
MQRPSAPDYYWDLGVAQTATPEEIQNAYRILENKYRTDRTEGPHKTQRDSALTDSISQARTAYKVLRQPSERAKYDTDYANVRAAWFRYRKWIEWQKGEDTTVVGGDVSPSNRLTGYSRKFKSKMKERRAQRSTVFVSGTPRNGRQEEVPDTAAGEELGEETSSQARSKASRATDPATGMRIRVRRSSSVPKPATTGRAGGQPWKPSFPPAVRAANYSHPAFIARIAMQQSAWPAD